MFNLQGRYYKHLFLIHLRLSHSGHFQFLNLFLVQNCALNNFDSILVILIGNRLIIKWEFSISIMGIDVNRLSITVEIIHHFRSG
jgi:hypothetical protein